VADLGKKARMVDLSQRGECTFIITAVLRWQEVSAKIENLGGHTTRAKKPLIRENILTKNQIVVHSKPHVLLLYLTWYHLSPFESAQA